MVDPKGFLGLESFRLEGTKPVWTYALADALLEKRVWMRQGENTTYVQYTLVRASGPLEMDLKALVNYRDFHSTTHSSDWRMNIEAVEHGVKVLPFAEAVPFYLRSAEASCEPRHEWYCNCFLPAERERGLDDNEDHLFAALFHAKLDVGKSLTIALSTEANAFLDGETVRAEQANHEVRLFSAWQAANENAGDAPSWIWQLVLAADQFVVRRSLPSQPEGRSIIAGYHWFGDWGRDTMIALPGLTLSTGRPDVAKQILLAFAQFVDGGMLPNNFPDAGGKPEYNTVDAARRKHDVRAVHAGAGEWAAGNRSESTGELPGLSFHHAYERLAHEHRSGGARRGGAGVCGSRALLSAKRGSILRAAARVVPQLFFAGGAGTRTR